MASFDTTKWSLVIRAGSRDPDAARAALEDLCRAYWKPLRAHVRRVGGRENDADDLTQAFIASLLERGDLGSVSQEKGRFRSWLLACLDNFLAHERDRAAAQKRGGGRTASLEQLGEAALEDHALPSPEETFDREWALALLERAKAALRTSEERLGRAELHRALEPALVPGEGGESLQDLAIRLNRSGGSLKVALHRLRRRFGECVRAEIAETVAEPGQVDVELRHLVSLVGRRV